MLMNVDQYGHRVQSDSTLVREEMNVRPSSAHQISLLSSREKIETRDMPMSFIMLMPQFTFILLIVFSRLYFYEGYAESVYLQRHHHQQTAEMSAEEDFDAMYEQQDQQQQQQQQQNSGGLHQLQPRHQRSGHGPVQQQQQQKHRRPKAATPHVNNEIPNDYVCWSCILRHFSSSSFFS